MKKIRKLKNGKWAGYVRGRRVCFFGNGYKNAEAEALEWLEAPLQMVEMRVTRGDRSVTAFAVEVPFGFYCKCGSESDIFCRFNNVEIYLYAMCEEALEK